MDTESLKDTLRDLYFGNTQKARTFRLSILVFDVVAIAFFIISSMLPDSPWIYAVDAVFAVLISLDLAARLALSNSPLRHLTRFTTITDIVVIISLLMPLVLENFLFLRIFRALRLLRSYHVLRDFREVSTYFRRNEELIQSTVSLLVFIFVMTALVYVLQVGKNPKIANYVDALYFTVTTLTTTGFGDITLEGTTGRLLSVAIMVFGVGLFLRLIQAIFRPAHVNYECPDCGLNRHDPDAVHCKHCGRLLHITTEGVDG
ncbi:MAG: hypothetical protein RLZ98_902 [Pseudomonadota bacterium]|jgi:voltage-gated potassium channel